MALAAAEPREVGSPRLCPLHAPAPALEAVAWGRFAWRLSDPADRRAAAGAVADGAVMSYGFGNFFAVASRPCAGCVRYVNLAKGRPASQPGSVTTTRRHVGALFDWAAVPTALGRSRVLEVVDDLLALGPFGFRGPSAADIPDHLTTLDGQTRTVQLIAPGDRCPSNELVEQIVDRIPEDFLFITSANRSHFATGNSEEPAHHRMSGIQADFGGVARFVMIAHDDERSLPAAYPSHAACSTTILSFHRADRGPTGRPALTVERHGSLPIPAVRALLRRHGLDARIGERARIRLTVREYAGP
jgi:hypothetical protein